MAGDRLLQILDEGNAKATFFMLGYVAEKHPELVKRIEAKRSMDVWGNGFFDNIEEPVGIVKAMKDCTKALR